MSKGEKKETTTAKATNALFSALQARIPGIHIQSLEETRAIDCIRAAVFSFKDNAKTLYLWSVAEGMKRLGQYGENETVSSPPFGLDEALQSFTNTPEKSVLILPDPWDELSRAIYQRYFKLALVAARKDGKALIVLGKDWKCPSEIKADIRTISLPVPGRDEITEFITALCGQYEEKLPGKLKIDRAFIPALAGACQGLTFNEIRSVVSLSLVTFRAIDGDAVKLAIKEKKQIVQRSGILIYEDVQKSLSDVGGLENIKAFVSKRAKLYSDSARNAGIKAPKGILLVGLPGVGKTLIARAIAEALNGPLVRLEAGRLFGSLVGESESNWREVAATAEAVAPCTLMIDEVEKGFGKSSGGDGGTSTRVFGSVLSWLQDKTAPVFVVATANDTATIPTEFMRPGRFDAVFFVDLPNVAAREEIFKIHIEAADIKVKATELFKLAQSTVGYTGAEIEQVVQNAMIEAYDDNGRRAGFEDFKTAIRSVKPQSVTMADRIKVMRDWAKTSQVLQAGSSVESDVKSDRVEVLAEI